MRAVRQLDVWSLGGVLGEWEGSFPRPLIDLSRCQTIDPFAAAFLMLYVRRCGEAGGRARILLPSEGMALRDLVGSGLFDLVWEHIWTDRPPQLPEEEASQFATFARVEDEQGVHKLVDQICDALEKRFPLGESSVRILAQAMLELAQNIPQHANPLHEDIAPWGLMAVREYEDHIHLVVMDKGVGLRRSLGLNPRYRGLEEKEALEAVLIQGASRFSDPGRGGALARIRRVIQANEGRLFVRSGGAGFWQAEVEWSVGEVYPFPGVQISIQLPRALFFG